MISGDLFFVTKFNNVNNCKNVVLKSKVLKINAVIKIVGRGINQILFQYQKPKGVYDMYAMWPGCYSFRDEIKMMALWMKEWLNSLILKIYEIDSRLHC